jgi:hypothetical protein
LTVTFRERLGKNHKLSEFVGHCSADISAGSFFGQVRKKHRRSFMRRVGETIRVAVFLGPSQLSAEDQRKVQDAVAKVND